jgi:16S rRNA (guanine527-N7)-methyltransferase
MELLLHYFPDLSAKQIKQFKQLEPAYATWNAQINVISRKDTENFYERHVLHSLAIAKIQPFENGASILDVGTGGGFPGIPLAILFPNCSFTLVDSIGKKIKVVNEIALEIGLSNVLGIHERAEKIDQQFDFIVSRAVTAMPAFIQWTKDKFKKKQLHELKNGILYLKGGDLAEELKGVNKFYKVFELDAVFKEDFFETKKVVYVRN